MLMTTLSGWIKIVYIPLINNLILHYILISNVLCTFFCKINFYCNTEWAEICKVIPVFFQKVRFLFLKVDKFTATPEM